MEGRVGLDTLAELSVALVGFSALIAMFRGGSLDTWHPRALITFWAIIGSGFGTLLFALLPSVMGDLGGRSWVGPMISLALYQAVAMTLVLRRHFQLRVAGIGTPNSWIYLIGVFIVAGTVLVLVLGVFGGLGGPSYFLYHFGVLSTLLISALAFVGVLRLSGLPAA